MAAGYLGDRFRNKASLFLGISLATLGVSYALAGLAPNFWTMMGVMLLVGAAPSLYHPPAISALAGLAIQPLMGYLSDQLGRNAVLLPGMVVITALTFALSVVEPGSALVFVIIAKGAFKFSLHHIFVAAAIDAAQGQVQSTVVSLVYGAGVLGIFSPYVAGLISDAYGIHSAFVYGGSVALLSTVTLLFVRLPRSVAQAEATR